MAKRSKPQQSQEEIESNLHEYFNRRHKHPRPAAFDLMEEIVYSDCGYGPPSNDPPTGFEGLNYWIAGLSQIAAAALMDDQDQDSKRYGSGLQHYLDFTLGHIERHDWPQAIECAMVAASLAVKLDSYALEPLANWNEARAEASAAALGSIAADNQRKVLEARAKLIAESPEAATYSGKWNKKRVTAHIANDTGLSARLISGILPKRGKRQVNAKPKRLQ